jgi:formylmethanofuran dehydrogenase subunit C
VSGLELALRAPVRLPVDAAALSPGTLLGRPPAEVERLELPVGNARLPLAELFTIRRHHDEALVLRGDLGAFAKLGAGMDAGTLRVEGDAGPCLGVGIRGGRIEVTGSADVLAGAMMADGLIRIGGNAGDLLGGPLPGERKAMRGGTILVQGDAGDRAGERMRRGLIVVLGNAGAYVGANLIAGTVIVQGSCGPDPGYRMRRGTLLLASPPERLLATFADCGAHALPWLRLLERHLRGLGIAAEPDVAADGPYRRLAGDLAELGLGEILFPAQ